MEPQSVMLIVMSVIIIAVLFKSIVIVPSQTAFVIERLAKYQDTLTEGFHILLPFLDKVVYKHSLKEACLEVPSQKCVTNDNNKFAIDAELYLKVVDPAKASYGVTDYKSSITRLAQTKLRSAVATYGKDDLPKSREAIDAALTETLNDQAGVWGIEVTRYEINDIDTAGRVF